MTSETNKPRPKAPTPVRLPEALKAKAKIIAEERNVSLSALICEAVAEKMDGKGPAPVTESHGELASKVARLESKIDRLTDASFLKSRGEMIAYMDELKASINRLDASVSVNKLTREEVLDAMTLIAKFTPQIEGQYDQFSRSLAEKSKAQEASFDRFIEAIDESESGVQKSVEIWSNFSQAFANTRASVNDWHAKLRNTEKEFDVAAQRMNEFQLKVEEELQYARRTLFAQFTKFFGGAFAVVILSILALLLAKYWGLFS